MATRGRVLSLPGLLKPISTWLQAHERVNFWLQVFRLGLFQFGMGISLAPLVGTLNRVLIDELNIPAVAVGFLIAIHYFVSPIRAMVGFQSDKRRAMGRWRTPYIAFGAMLTYGGLATAPFSLIVLSLERIPFAAAMAACTLIFLAYGIGVNIVETTYLALVSDLTPPKERGRVLAALWMMLVMGTVVSSVVMGALLVNYSHGMLIRVMQGSAALFIILTLIALLGRERMRPDGSLITEHELAPVRMSLGDALGVLWQQKTLRQLFVILFISTLAFSTQDVLLEPYGGQVLGMSVSATTQLTALWGAAMIVAVAIAGWLLWRGRLPSLPILSGCAVGALGFLTVSLSSRSIDVSLFRSGVALIGVGRGLFIVGSIALVMSLADRAHTGLFMGLWGVMQALAQGFGTIGGGLVRDIVQRQLGSITFGYTMVYMSSLGLLILALILLVVMRLGRKLQSGDVQSPWAGLQDLPADQLIA